MAHYAYLNENNVVIKVVVGKDETNENINWEEYYGAKRTSYNTCGGQHPNGTPFRKNFAGTGYSYDEGRDAFIPPKPYPSWILDEETCWWHSPVPRPDDGIWYVWDESILNWGNSTPALPYPTDGNEYAWDYYTQSWIFQREGVI